MVAFLFVLKCLFSKEIFQSQEIGSELMIDLNRSKLSDQDITDLSGLFDMLAMFDFEDTQKVSGLSQEIDKDFSSVKGKSLPASCDQDKTNELENPSSKGTEVKRLL